MRTFFKSPISFSLGMSLCVGLLIAAAFYGGRRELHRPLDEAAKRVVDRQSDRGILFSKERVDQVQELSFPHTSNKDSSTPTPASNRQSGITSKDHRGNARDAMARNAADPDPRPGPTTRNGQVQTATAATTSAAASAQRLAAAEAFPSRQKLERMAQSAEQRANRELDRLIETLDLNEGQQELVFEILARSSEDFVPVMVTESDLGGVVEPLLESTESTEEAIEVVLNEEQASKYKEEIEERRAWWWATLRDFIPDEELPDVVEESETYVP